MSQKYYKLILITLLTVVSLLISLNSQATSLLNKDFLGVYAGFPLKFIRDSYEHVQGWNTISLIHDEIIIDFFIIDILFYCLFWFSFISICLYLYSFKFRIKLTKLVRLGNFAVFFFLLFVILLAVWDIDAPNGFSYSRALTRSERLEIWQILYPLYFIVVVSSYLLVKLFMKLAYKFKQKL